MHPENENQPAGLSGARGVGAQWWRAPGWALPVALGLAVLAGCGGSSSGGGGSNDDSGDDAASAETVEGNATKGPLANADVTVFRLDPTADDLRGEQVATGDTDDQARIRAELPGDADGLVVVAVQANDGTTDLTTGEAPVLSRLSSVTDAGDWLDGEPVYATPLSHMAVEIAARNVPDDAGRGRTGSALARAQEAVRATVGFGLLEDADGEPIDLFATAPILTDDATDAEDRRRTLRYRKASEAVAAVMAEIAGSSEAGDIQALFDDVIEDLSSGRIDDDDVGSQLESTDPESLPIPNEPDGRTIAETRDIVNEEREAVGTSDDGNELTADDDEPAEPAQRDSGLTSEDLAGAIVELTLSASPAAGGSPATSDGDPLDDGIFEVGVGDTVTVEANPSSGYALDAWVDESLVEQSVDEAFSVEVPDEPFELTAQYVVTAAEPDDTEAGSVEVDGTFEDGEEVTVTAVPSSGYTFVEWQDADGNQVSTDAEHTFTYEDGDQLTAVFELDGEVAVWGDFAWDDGSVWAAE